MTMARVIYDSTLIIPGPLVSISENINRNESGKPLGSDFTITLNGYLFSEAGFPSQTDERFDLEEDEMLGQILRKQEELRNLFSNDGRSFEIQSADASQPLKCNPRVVSIDFSEGIWRDECKYTIVLNADSIHNYNNDIGDNLKSAQETWGFELDSRTGENGERIYRLSHSLVAVGKNPYNSSSVLTNTNNFQAAKNWCRARIGIKIDGDNARDPLTEFFSSSINKSDAYDYIKVENFNETTGEYSITENWILSDGGFAHDFTVQKTKSEGNNRASYTISGTFDGLERGSNGLNRAESAFSSLNPKSVIQSNFSGVTLRENENASTITRSKSAGTINYSYTYQEAGLFSNSLYESITINKSGGDDVFATIAIPFRTDGPIIQDMKTKTQAVKSVAIEALLDSTQIDIPSFDDSEIQNLKPDGAYTSETESWSPISGKYTKNITWTMENHG